MIGTESSSRAAGIDDQYPFEFGMLMDVIGSQLVKNALTIGAQLMTLGARSAFSRAKIRKIADKAYRLSVTDGIEDFVETLNKGQLRKMKSFIESPEFANLMLQMLVCSLGGYKETHLVNIRNQLRESLRCGGNFKGADLTLATDLLLDLIKRSAHSVQSVSSGHLNHAEAVTIASRVAAVSARNTQVLSRVTDLNEINELAEKLRKQVRALHGKLRLSSIVHSQAVPYGRLFVTPRLIGNEENSIERNAERSVYEARDLLKCKVRTVILGDPGAGKSTLAAKIAHDLASDKIYELKGQIPILFVVRNFTQELRNGHRSLLHYLKLACAKPYGVDVPEQTLEYLLCTGRATVIIDGVDELGDSHFREAFAQMVEAFASLFPLSRIVVTSRLIGYEEARLDSTWFPTVQISQFEPEQVERYAELWFRLRSGRSRQERADLANAFLRDSEEISDLRSNPLVLSLLCVLYSSEGYLPDNRPKIYEKCAELLFEGWDRSRGIDTGFRYHLHVKSAIRQLAWRIFTDRDGRQSLAESEILSFLVESVLSRKFDDSDAATQAAYDFLRFCSGRAWVLTDMGADRLRPIYGFVHRTFLEYFAAAQLVRRDNTPVAIWATLKPNLHLSEWRIVSTLTAQILEEQTQDGGDKLLRLIIDDIENKNISHLKDALSYAVECLQITSPDADTVRRVVEEAVRFAASVGVKKRRSSGHFSIPEDEPLSSMLRMRSPETKDRVAPLLLGALQKLTGSADSYPSAAHIYWALRRMHAEDIHPFSDYAMELPLPKPVEELRRVMENPSPVDVRNHGFGLLHSNVRFGSYTLYGFGTIALLNLHRNADLAERDFMIACLEDLYDAVCDTYSVAVSVGDQMFFSRYIVSGIDKDVLLELSPEARAVVFMLLTPFMRDLTSDSQRIQARDENEILFSELSWGQLTLEGLKSWNLPERALESMVRCIDQQMIWPSAP